MGRYRADHIILALVVMILFGIIIVANCYDAQTTARLIAP